MDPPSRVQSFYHSAMMSITWLCTLPEEEEENILDLTNNNYEKFDELLNEFNNSTDHCRVL